MSKGLGLKIGIKFTQELSGDISGNEGAFSVQGFEPLFDGGPVVAGTYVIDTVSRYPIPRYFTGDLTDGDSDDVEVFSDGVRLGVI